MLNTVFWGNTITQYLIFLGAIITGVLIGKIVYFVIKRGVSKVTAATETELDDVIIEALERPLVFLIVLGGFYFGFLQLTIPAGIETKVMQGLKLLLMVTGFWFLIGFVDRFFERIVAPLSSRTKTDLDDNLVPLLRKSIRYVLIVVAAITIVSNFGYDIGSLLAGLGIGGLAFALAAKDMLGNLFGGISLIADAPFRVGDTIQFDGIEGGSVKSVGLRSSRIETWDGPIVTVPNSVLANNVIVNRAKWKRYRVKMTLGLTYNTKEDKVQKAISIVKKILKKHKGIDDNLARVHFINFGPSSLDIQVIYFINDLERILETRDEVNFRIKEEFDKARLNFAFPTQTIEWRKVK